MGAFISICCAQLFCRIRTVDYHWPIEPLLRGRHPSKRAARSPSLRCGRSQSGHPSWWKSWLRPWRIWKYELHYDGFISIIDCYMFNYGVFSSVILFRLWGVEVCIIHIVKCCILMGCWRIAVSYIQQHKNNPR